MVSFKVVSLLISHLTQVVDSEINRSKVIQLVKHEQCDELSEKTGNILPVSAQSILDCARICHSEKHCQGIGYSIDDEVTSRCRLFSSSNQSQTSNFGVTLSSVDNAQCYKLALTSTNDISMGTTLVPESSTPICTTTTRFTQCYKKPSSDLHRSSWFVFVDSNNPETQKNSYIKSRTDSNSGGKCVVLDSSGNYYVFVADLGLKMQSILTYTIEKDDNGFVDNPGRIVHSCGVSGKLLQDVIYPNGTQTKHSIPIQQIQFIVSETSDYTLETFDVNNLIVWLQQGFNIDKFQYAVISDDNSTVSIYSINQDMLVSTGGKGPGRPLSFRQLLHKFPINFQKIRNKLGVPGNLFHPDTAPPKHIKLSPFWSSVNSKAMDIDEQIAVLSKHMSHGHRFRVGFNKSFFDVHDVFQIDDDIYFILPQQLTKAKDPMLTLNTTGVRAVVSFKGVYSSCTHPLEGENVLRTDLDFGLNVQSFLDEKAWSPIFSVFGDGTWAFGNPTDLAEEVLSGKDLNVLIKWLDEDKSRLLSTTMTTIKDYGQPSVSINAESVVSLSLSTTSPGNVELNSHCNMEKVLVKSNGEVQTLVYNTIYRGPVLSIINVQTIWFVY